eukprot:GHVL01030148.1.p1 GENE.GHVL01030148.1~~GHVL01030148.1.p1  ORF type:complete len:270 (-),score=51.34 GHVL01030148.1:42-851(-)
MNTTSAPQIILHIQQNLDFTPFESRWAPDGAIFAVAGQFPRATGALSVFRLNKGALEVVHKTEKPHGFKCGTFAATLPGDFHFVTGDYNGGVSIWDMEDMKKPLWNVDKGHTGIINAIDGCGGQNIGYGAPEIVTGGRDGCVKVWDKRVDTPVLSLEPAVSDNCARADCWTVAFGNSSNENERCIAAGYDNGDLKLFDLRTNTLLWDTNLSNGVCHIQFDRKDIIMNKMAVSTLQAKMAMFDMRTCHPEDGYASVVEHKIYYINRQCLI